MVLREEVKRYTASLTYPAACPVWQFLCCLIITVLCMAQALYQMEIQLRLDRLGLSDTVLQRFGVREIESRIDAELGGHTFYVNGVKVTHFVSNTNALEASCKRLDKCDNDARVCNDVLYLCTGVHPWWQLHSDGLDAALVCTALQGRSAHACRGTSLHNLSSP